MTRIELRLVAAMLLLVAPAAAQAPVAVPPSTSYTQTASGMVFPPTVGEFRRIEVVRYARDGSDESAGYNRIVPQAEISATIYVFPSPPIVSIASPRETIEIARSLLCTQQYQAISAEIAAVHSDATARGAAPLRDYHGTPGPRTHSGLYAYHAPVFLGRTNVDLLSEVHVLCYVGGHWTVEYRIDYPADYNAAADVNALMSGLDLTIPAER